jgi:ribonuclease BN (tRNA processing enzyme)
MQVTFLGTNGWYDTQTGNTCSVLLQSPEYDIILDAGNGLAKADRHISQDKPVILFISHFHLDHIAGLHTLVKFSFREGLTICGQPGSSRLLGTFVSEPFTVPFRDLPYEVRVLEIGEGNHDCGFPVTCRQLVHPAPCMGFRLTLGGKVIAYCTDTGVCDNIFALARGADLLITECSLKPGQSSPGWPHLNPEDAIMIAKKAGVKRLALTHFGAEVYRTISERMALEEMFAREFPGLIVAMDGKTIEV